MLRREKTSEDASVFMRTLSGISRNDKKSLCDSDDDQASYTLAIDQDPKNLYQKIKQSEQNFTQTCLKLLSTKTNLFACVIFKVTIDTTFIVLAFWNREGFRDLAIEVLFMVLTGLVDVVYLVGLSGFVRGLKVDGKR